MEEYTLPDLTEGWNWYLDTDDPRKIRLWVYFNSGPITTFRGSSEKFIVAEVEAGINEPEYVANNLFVEAESSMEWGSWSAQGQENQESLRGLLGLT